jgi:hypothetical protein
MKTTARLALLALLPVLTAAAADVTGKWIYKQTGRGRTTPVTIVLKAEGGKLTGSVSQPGRGATTEREITSGRVEGRKLSFEVDTEGRGTTTFTGTVDGDTMKLKITRGAAFALGETEVVAKRCPPDCE